MHLSKKGAWKKRMAAWWDVRPCAIPIVFAFFAGGLFMIIPGVLLSAHPIKIIAPFFSLLGVLVGTGMTTLSQGRIQKQQMMAETRRIRREKMDRVVGLFNDLLGIEHALLFEQKELYSNKDRTKKMIDDGSHSVEEIKIVLLMYFPSLHERWIIDEQVAEDGKEYHHYYEMFEGAWRGMKRRLEEILQGKGEPKSDEDDFRLRKIWPDLLEEAREQVA